MNENETAALVRALDRAYINGKFVTPHGTQVVDLVNPTNNTVIGKVTMADEIDTRQAIAAAKEAFNTFSQSSKEYRMDCLQRLHDAVARRMDQLVDATVLEADRVRQCDPRYAHREGRNLRTGLVDIDVQDGS